jgi:immediate early response 3-interacting protein 1
MNALLILNRRRFLSKFGLDPSTNASTTVGHPNNNNNNMSMKAQLIGLLHAVQYLKVPIIICNTITIVLEMLLGGT